MTADNNTSTTNDNQTLENLIEEEKKAEIYYDIGYSISQNPYKYSNLKILIIDDNKESIIELYERLKIVFVELNWEFYGIFNKDEIKKFINNDLYTSSNGEFKVYKIHENQSSQDSIEIENISSIIVDLLLFDKNNGINIIRNLDNFRRLSNLKLGKKYFFNIFAMSRSQDVEDIQRALKEGALYFIPKSNILRLPGVVAKFEESRKILKDTKTKSSFIKKDKYRNFGKLYNLPKSVINNLQVEKFLEENQEDDDGTIKKIKRDIAKGWIKKLPKADIHFHLGGSMTADIVFNTSLNSLSYINKKCLKKVTEELKNLMNGGNSDDNCLANILKALKDNNNNNNIENKIKKLKNKKSKEIEECFDKIYEKITANNNCEFKRFQIVNLFNVIVGIFSGYDKKDIEKFWDVFEKHLYNNNSNDNNPNNDKIFKSIKKKIKDDLTYFKVKDRTKKNKKLIELFNSIKTIIITNPNDNQVTTNGKNYLKEIIEYPEDNESKEPKNNKCNDNNDNKFKDGCLEYYLNGAEFTGSELLQFYENILMTVYHLMRNSIDDNVRYLEIRCSPDGYTKEKLNINGAINALLNGADFASRLFFLNGNKNNKASEFIWANFIFTAKRHKSPAELSVEIASAISNRERDKVSLSIKDTKIDNKYGSTWQWSRLVGMDLAGLENKETRPAKFKDDFLPVAKTSFPLTVHAGEQDTYQSIWEAIYLLHARRIGHGLSLTGDINLMNMIKNTGTCIEINPYSNIYTNPKLKDKHPIFDYINTGVHITIGTDDKALSGTELSDEYVKAAELYYEHKNNKKNKVYLTKWDIIKLIKNSFVSAFLHRGEKRELLKAVENEIYILLIKNTEYL